jgi:hypothetical protein
MTARPTGDDLHTNRLLSNLNRKSPFRINKLKKIRKNVYMVETDRSPFILKGYSSLQRLQLQEAFTSSLKSEGFLQTYSFYRFFENPIYYNKKYYGWIEYLEPHRDRFTYATHDNRKEGLDLLHTFHLTTKNLSKRYERVLPEFNLYDKWAERLRLFENNSSIIGNYLSETMINELLNWGKYSITGLKNEEKVFGNTTQPVILHGDVAHHNYLRSKSGKLYLIDFDLISIGPESADLLQYANRILPSIHWSLHQLFQLPQFYPYLQNRAFLFALMYPTDIFREWNRIIKDGSYHYSGKLLPVIELTTSQFHLRQQFIIELKNVVK